MKNVAKKTETAAEAEVRRALEHVNRIGRQDERWVKDEWDAAIKRLRAAVTKREAERATKE